jgi:hypothetical protein
MIGSFLSPFDRAAWMVGAPPPEKRIRSWQAELAIPIEPPRFYEDCAHLSACRDTFVTPRTKEPEAWRCPNGCPDHEALVPADRLVRDRP